MSFCVVGSNMQPRAPLQTLVRMLCYGQNPQATCHAQRWHFLTLRGNLTPDGAHLHASVSDAAGRVLGGHVCAGCAVRTTVELLWAPLPGGSLARAFDAATGYPELRVRDS